MAVRQLLGVAERLRRSEVADAIRRERAVAILRRLPPAAADPTVEALLAGGFAIVEFTVDSEGGFDAISRWRRSGRALVGAGTVRRAELVDPAVEAGAQCLVAPTYQADVVERALELGVACIPGCLSPTEIDTAWEQGASFVKLFPGGAVGPSYLRAVLAPLPEVEIVVTGGVDDGSARGFIDAGAVAVGVSTAQLGEAEHLDSIEAGSRRLLAALR
jgi:2-dehydro-3-deoxyphosphogluconate aldolase/(4S)-4-hydroxy-2-oxoglutarate aldolase